MLLPALTPDIAAAGVGMTVGNAFDDAWRLPIGVPGPPTTWLVARPPKAPGEPIGEAEVRRASQQQRSPSQP